MRQRQYETYDAYVEHQASKLKKLDLTKYNEMFKPALSDRLAILPQVVKNARGATVLCLGARNGAECEVFVEMGFFAIGIDLNPGEANKLVVTGDFHNLQFADDTVDVVFTNVLDHVFDLNLVLGEVKRVLKPGGLFVAEIVRGSKDEGGREPGDFEAIWWDHSSTVADQIKTSGFALWEARPFHKPWVGDQFIFILGNEEAPHRPVH